MDVCVRLFCVCVVLCVSSCLVTGWSPVEGVLRTVYRLGNWKSRQGPTKGRKAIEEEEDYTFCIWQHLEPRDSSAVRQDKVLVRELTVLLSVYVQQKTPPAAIFRTNSQT
jgi:hypothetical protein